MTERGYTVQSTLSVKDELNAALLHAIENARTLAKAMKDVQAASNGAFARATRAATYNIGGMTGGGFAGGTGASASVGAGTANSFAAAAAQAERLNRATELMIRNVGALRAMGSGGGGRLPPIWRGYPQLSGGSGGGGWGGGGGGYSGTIIPPGGGGGGIAPRMGPTIYRNAVGGGAGGGGNVPPTGGPGRAFGAGGGHLGGLLDGYILMQAGHIGRRFGQGMLDSLGATLAAAGAYQRQVDLLQVSGLSGTDIAAAQRAAQATATALPSTSLAGNLKALGEARSVLGSMTAAITFLQPMMRYSILASAVTGRQSDPYTAFRAAEMLGWTTNQQTGALDPQRAQQFFDIMTRAELGTHGRVDERQLFNFAQMASLAAKNMTAQGLLEMIPIINEMGGLRAGTALQSINQQINGGVVPQRIVEDWNKLHLVNMNDVTATRTGVRIAPGAFKNGAMLSENPVAWIETTLVPAMQKAGYNRQQQATEIMRLFSRSTSQREAGIIATQMVSIAKDVQMMLKTLPSQSAVSVLEGQDYQLNMANMAGAWNQLMVRLGTAIIPVVVPALRMITNALIGLADFAREHPTITKTLLITAAALGAVAVVAGTAATAIGGLAIAFSALAGVGALGTMSFSTFAGLALLGPEVAIAIGAVGAAIWGLSKVPWTRLTGFINGVQTDIFNAVNAGTNWAITKITGLGTQLGDAIWGVIQAAIKYAEGKLAGLVPGLGGGSSDAAAPGSPHYKVVGKGVVLVPGAAAAAPTHEETHSLSGPNARHQQGLRKSIADAVAAGVANGLNGAVVQMDGKAVGAIVTHHQVEALRRPVRGKTAFDNRSAPRYPNHAVPLRG